MFLGRGGQLPRGEPQLPPETGINPESPIYGRVSPSNFNEILGFVIIDGALRTAEGSVVTVEQHRGYLVISDLMIVQEPE